MDPLMKDILAEVKSKPNTKFKPNDLSHLQSPLDIKYAMIYLYTYNCVSGEPVYSSDPLRVGEIEYMKWICFSE